MYVLNLGAVVYNSSTNWNRVEFLLWLSCVEVESTTIRIYNHSITHATIEFRSIFRRNHGIPGKSPTSISSLCFVHCHKNQKSLWHTYTAVLSVKFHVYRSYSKMKLRQDICSLYAGIAGKPINRKFIQKQYVFRVVGSWTTYSSRCRQSSLARSVPWNEWWTA